MMGNAFLDHYDKKTKNKARSKYNTPKTKAEKAITCKCNSGHIHNSRDEKRYCDILLLRLKAKDIQSYKVEQKYSLDVNGVHICNHYVDFEVVTNENKIEAHEYKGFPTAIWKLKEKLFRAVYPDIPYIVIKEADLNRMFRKII